jgi:hypothetical protein
MVGVFDLLWVHFSVCWEIFLDGGVHVRRYLINLQLQVKQ